jgi:hypothetical protein
MLVQLGNVSPAAGLSPDGAPSVTYINIPEDYSVTEVSDIKNIALDLARGGSVTRLPGHEAFVSVVHGAGAWQSQSTENPLWAWSDNAVLQSQLQAFYGVGDRPEYFEESYHTLAGAPGVVPAVAGVKNVEMLLTNSGRNLFAQGLFGAGTGATLTEYVGSFTGATSSTLTGTGLGSIASNVAGMRVIISNTATSPYGYYGNVISVSSGTLTVDGWYPLGAGGQKATGSAPAFTTGVFTIVTGIAPAWYMALATGAATPAATDTSLTGEITTASGGLIRKAAASSFTTVSGTSTTVTLTATWTANGSDSLPATVTRIGVFNSSVVSDISNTMMFHTSLSASATLSASGDQLTVTDTITGP